MRRSFAYGDPEYELYRAKQSAFHHRYLADAAMKVALKSKSEGKEYKIWVDHASDHQVQARAADDVVKRLERNASRDDPLASEAVTTRLGNLATGGDWFHGAAGGQ